MTCRFEVTSSGQQDSPEGSEYQLVVSGDVFLPGGYNPYLKVFIDMPVGPESSVSMDQIRSVMTSKEFYTQIRRAFNPITK